MQPSFTLFYPHKSKALRFNHVLEKKIYRFSSLNSDEGDLNDFLRDLEKDKIEGKDQLIFWNFPYETGNLFQKLEIKNNNILGVRVAFSRKGEWVDKRKTTNQINWRVEKKKNYRKKFQQVFSHLLRGDAYQVNLTDRFYPLDEDLNFNTLCEEMMNSVSCLSRYAHSFSWKEKSYEFLSNSPECLFHIKNQKLNTFPIKGTMKDSENFKKLNDSKKNEAELDMITDLLRNDLTSLEGIPSQVLKRKLFFYVPGLIHQMSHIQVPLSKNLSLGHILKKIFPGGSITGAPKNNVMQLISKIEDQPRGIYCGSTVVLWGKRVDASINIRTLWRDEKSKRWTYGSGGGVTLLSESEEEEEEMLFKVSSFGKIFETPII